MVKIIILLMTGLAFCIGVLLGLLVRLPGASLPSADLHRYERSLEYSKLYAKSTQSGKGNISRDYYDTVLFQRLLGSASQTKQSSNNSEITHFDSALKNNGDERLSNDIKSLDSLIREKTRDSRNDLKEGYIQSPGDITQFSSSSKEGHTPNTAEAGLSTIKTSSDIGVHNDHGGNMRRLPDLSLALPFWQATGHDTNTSALKYLVDGIYWSPRVDSITPQGFTAKDVKHWRKIVNDAKVVEVKEGCGRMQNRMLVFSDSTKACARHRINTDQIQGEIYSYYLSRVLGVHNVPPSVVVLANPHHMTWSSVDSDLARAQWHPQRATILTPWLENLMAAYIPKELRPSVKKLHPDLDLLNRSKDEIIELAQWSDLIVFDYLTANLDRVVNNMFNQQWNSDMMDSPTHNLERTRTTNQLIFLDNESGLFHSYRLLEKYSNYHESLLKSLCIFRKRTADIIKKLCKEGNVEDVLQNALEREEPLYKSIARMPSHNVRTLQERLDSVHQQIQHCESIYTR